MLILENFKNYSGLYTFIFFSIFVGCLIAYLNVPKKINKYTIFKIEPIKIDTYDFQNITNESDTKLHTPYYKKLNIDEKVYISELKESFPISHARSHSSSSKNYTPNYKVIKINESDFIDYYKISDITNKTFTTDDDKYKINDVVYGTDSNGIIELKTYIKNENDVDDINKNIDKQTNDLLIVWIVFLILSIVSSIFYYKK